MATEMATTTTTTPFTDNFVPSQDVDVDLTTTTTTTTTASNDDAIANTNSSNTNRIPLPALPSLSTIASQNTHNHRTIIPFTEVPKVSTSVVEMRIDYHLNRIMKEHRVHNFVNAIKDLPQMSRICEKLMEILVSTENMIDRKLAKIKETKDMLAQLNALGNELCPATNTTTVAFNKSITANPVVANDDQEVKDKLAAIWKRFKSLAIATEQVSWALNSNKEHLRYVARMMVIPEVYKRSPEENISMRVLFNKIVLDCEEVIEICRCIRHGFEMQLRAIYSAVHFNPRVSNGLANNNGSNDQQNSQQIAETAM